MPASHAPRLALIGATGVLLGAALSTAFAQDALPLPTPPAAHRACKAFVSPTDRMGEVDTADRTTEIGQWVASRSAEGWQLADLDFEMVNKSNGYPQGWVHVCVSR